MNQTAHTTGRVQRAWWLLTVRETSTVFWLLGVLIVLLAGGMCGPMIGQPKRVRWGTMGRRDVPAIVDINTAAERVWLQLPGMGPSLAGKILADRTAHGAFSSVEDLVRVKGVGPTLLNRWRPYLRINPVDSPAAND